MIGLRALVSIIDFTTTPTFKFRAITGIENIHFLGETLFVPIGVPSPWARLGEGSALLACNFVLDAAHRLWRRGSSDERRRAVVIGGAAAVTILFATANGLLIHTGVLLIPYFVSLCYVLFIAAMDTELSRDLIHAVRMTGELTESSESMALAARAAHQAFWRWDIVADAI